jgi:acyl-CoA thioester hydrolase
VTEYSLPIVPRYAEIDQQGVVFNGHYLTWFDEAVTGYFDHLGASYPDLMSADLDMQVVHTEIDYAAPVRWRDTVRVDVMCERVGETSFTIGFSVLATRAGSDESIVVRGRNVYVVVSAEDWTKRPIPGALRKVLSP